MTKSTKLASLEVIPCYVQRTQSKPRQVSKNANQQQTGFNQ
jgi:hypothetical protein